LASAKLPLRIVHIWCSILPPLEAFTLLGQTEYFIKDKLSLQRHYKGVVFYLEQY